MFCLEQIGTGVNIAEGHAEYRVAYANATQLLPEGLSYERAAPVFCAGYTVYSGLRIAEPQPHERVAIVGVGGLGHLAIQYAKATGFETIAITHSKDKEELAYKLGSDVVVSDGKGLKNSGRADVILATSNSYRAMGDTLKGLRLDGTLILMGISDEPLTVIGHLLMNRGRIIGSIQNDREYLYEALDYVAKGKVNVMTETFPLEEVNKAYDNLANGEVRFRAALKIR
jgi:alcohol dehydrogenase